MKIIWKLLNFCELLKLFHFIKTLPKIWDSLCDSVPVVKKNNGGVLFLTKLQTEACNVTTKSNTPPWVFFEFAKLRVFRTLAPYAPSRLHISFVFLPDTP